MYNIVYFEKNITDCKSKAFKYYNSLYDTNIISNKILFCDSHNIIYDMDTAVFHTYYLLEYFNNKIIVCDKQNLQWIEDHIKDKIMVIYDSTIEDVSSVKNKNIICNDILNPTNIKDII